MTGDHKRLEPRRDTNMAETNFRGKISKPVTSRENTINSSVYMSSAVAYMHCSQVQVQVDIRDSEHRYNV